LALKSDAAHPWRTAAEKSAQSSKKRHYGRIENPSLITFKTTVPPTLPSCRFADCLRRLPSRLTSLLDDTKAGLYANGLQDSAQRL
jgi:hypothetical protein